MTIMFIPLDGIRGSRWYFDVGNDDGVRVVAHVDVYDPCSRLTCQIARGVPEGTPTDLAAPAWTLLFPAIVVEDGMHR